MSIRNKLLITVLIFLTIPMFFMPILVYRTYENILKEKVNASLQQTLVQIANSVNIVIDNMIAVSNMIFLDKGIIDVLQNNAYDSEWDEYIDQSKVLDRLDNARNAVLYPYNADLMIIGFNGNIYSSSVYDTSLKDYNEISKQNWFKQAMEKNGRILWMAPAGNYMKDISQASKGNIAMARLIKGNENISYGVLLISLYPEGSLESLLKSSKKLEGSHLLLINDKGSIITSSDSSIKERDLIKAGFFKAIKNGSEGSFTSYFKGQKALINYNTIPETNWKILQLIPYNVIMKEIEQLTVYNLTINLIFLLGLLGIFVFISWNITKPLSRLRTLMKEVTKGNFDVSVEIKGNDEVSQLEASFNSMVRQIDALIKQLNEEHRIRERTHLEVLQAQINPHFLFNTLNAIKWMAKMNGADNVSKMIADLGKLLETTLSNTEEMIPLSEEIDCVERYVSLQKMRYGDKFDVRYEIADDILQYKVPCLILQPLVENAIIHAFEDVDRGGLIVIKGYVQGDDILIEVIDNGKGIPEGRLKELLDNNYDRKSRFNNIGLKNVNERISLYYGSNYGLTMDSKQGIGTTIKLRLPVKEEILNGKSGNS
ncbi:sensor histidine kinase [Caldanaerobius polysaccharolyticus]|uniref:sensor histidine kinase n=1 Tax=Caldanaerobius polysaccharolyticus TaxID=44256 RepID=UPI00047945AC|nr:sensor histidine kinase [Caldanaerobius polysaccharolyticus]